MPPLAVSVVVPAAQALLAPAMTAVNDETTETAIVSEQSAVLYIKLKLPLVPFVKLTVAFPFNVAPKVAPDGFEPTTQLPSDGEPLSKTAPLPQRILSTPASGFTSVFILISEVHPKLSVIVTTYKPLFEAFADGISTSSDVDVNPGPAQLNSIGL